MTTARFTLCALPSIVWEQDAQWGNQAIAIRSFVADALSIERRLAKGVNLDNERTRYNLCCVRLEAALKLPVCVPVSDPDAFRLALDAFRLPASSLGAGYLDAIDLMVRKGAPKSMEMRLGATFFPPNMVEAHVAAFASLAAEMGLVNHADIQRRITFFGLARQHACGVVELQDPYHFEQDVTVLPPQVAVEKEAPPEFQAIEMDEGAFDNEGRNAFEILRERVEDALRHARQGRPGPVNFSNQPHNVVTEVLNEFAYSESGRAEVPVSIQVIYTDGSQGKPFPLRCLPRPNPVHLERLAQAQPLRAAMLSMRHLGMDHDVDMAWFRNREVSKARAFSETDEFCYVQTQKQLQESRAQGDLRLFFYQTGLQPAVIGFYRALIEELLYRSTSLPSIEVVPHYYAGKAGYRQGKVWL
jgi:hypothetical protein